MRPRQRRINLAAYLLGAALLFAGAAPFAAQPALAIGEATDPALPSARYRPEQVIVQLDPLLGATIAQIHQSYATITLATLGTQSPAYLLATPAGADAYLFAEQLELDPRIEHAEPNYLEHAPEGTGRNIKAWAGEDPTPFASQAAVAQLDLAAAHQLSRGAGTIVAVIDSGVQLDHPALAQRLAAGYDFLDGDLVPSDEENGLDDDGNGLVDEGFGHGTHVAGIVALVAPEAQIMPLRVLDSDGTGDAFAVTAAVIYATEHGADVINLSLGSEERSKVLRNAIRSATLSGAMVVAAAGNNGTSQDQYPAAAQCAIAVTSVGATGLRSTFASYGDWVDYAAPGEAIFSASPPNGYAYWSGTSMASPFVAGQAALIHSVAPAANVRQVASLIDVTAVRPPPLTASLGAGRIAIGASLRYWSARGFPPTDHDMSGSCVDNIPDS
jgi:thermitase